MKNTRIVKALAVSAVAGTMVLGAAIPASAATFTGKIIAYVHDTNNLNPYGITLSTGPQVWLYQSAYFISCSGAGVSDGSAISMTNLGRVKTYNHSIRINTTGQQTITCL